MRQFIASVGLRGMSVSVDDGRGIVAEALARSGMRAVLVTPAHQFPTSMVLADERGSALVSWAQATDGMGVEDDFDIEFRFDIGAPFSRSRERRPSTSSTGGRRRAAGSLSPSLPPSVSAD
ncbi:hypothetical protein ACSNOK_11020 [Streptomyces sp. URMC 126]|uniref:hypothetical protein n=1 Tax=Streptomyces sp. URMC 126 TaxID=3423401 RepID=UPI003F1B3485